MSPELDEQLCKKYPEIFKDRYGDIRNSCMPWGFDCGDGWYPLIDELCRLIMWHCDHFNYNIEKHEYDKLPYPVAVQVKEKFGTLRFYINGGDEAINNYISMADCLSGRICEECGLMKNARTWNFGWLRTLCVEHAIEKYGKEIVENYLNNREVENE